MFSRTVSVAREVRRRRFVLFSFVDESDVVIVVVDVVFSFSIISFGFIIIL